MIVESPSEFQLINVLVRVRNIIHNDIQLYLKNETLNPAGSIKFKPAVGIIRDLEVCGKLGPGMGIIDTTSGNMGIALSILARERGYRFVCVCDEKLARHNHSLLQAYGAELVVMPGSMLSERYQYIEKRVHADPSLIRIRQFMNHTNPDTHERTTAREVLDELPHLNWLFVGTGTAGTLRGCARALSRYHGKVRLVAVDTTGSAHFVLGGRTGGKRLLPGIGATERSQFLDGIDLHDVIIVPEREAVDTCRELVRKTAWLFGASSGSVVAAIKRLEHSFKAGDVVVGIAADSGERYLDSVYDDAWVTANLSS